MTSTPPDREQRIAVYRQALDAGLGGYRRRRTVIQLASTLRNLGRPEESVALLTAERDTDPAGRRRTGARRALREGPEE
jgi:hypothetical protein